MPGTKAMPLPVPRPAGATPRPRRLIRRFEVRHDLLRECHHLARAAERHRQRQDLAVERRDHVGQRVGVGAGEAVDRLPVVADDVQLSARREELAHQRLPGARDVLRLVDENHVAGELHPDVLDQRPQHHVVEVDDVGLVERQPVEVLRGGDDLVERVGLVQPVDVVVLRDARPGVDAADRGVVEEADAGLLGLGDKLDHLTAVLAQGGSAVTDASIADGSRSASMMAVGQVAHLVLLDPRDCGKRTGRGPIPWRARSAPPSPSSRCGRCA